MKRRRTHPLFPRFRDGTCRRLVMDTNVAWYAPERSFESLRQRGFLLSLSQVAVAERWVRAAKRSDPEHLTKRSSVLARYVDPEFPVAPAGAPLEHVLCCGVGCRHEHGELARRLRTRWRAVTRGEVEDFLKIGHEADREMEAASLDLGTPPPIPKSLEGVVTSPTLVAGVAQASARRLGDSLIGDTYERYNAFLHYFVQLQMDAPSQQIAVNDSDDLSMLRHLIAPLFLVTDDRKMWLS